jgi:hypothetical protein
MRFYLGSITLIISTLSAFQVYNLYNNNVSYNLMISGYRPDIAQAVFSILDRIIFLIIILI